MVKNFKTIASRTLALAMVCAMMLCMSAFAASYTPTLTVDSSVAIHTFDFFDGDATVEVDGDVATVTIAVKATVNVKVDLMGVINVYDKNGSVNTITGDGVSYNSDTRVLTITTSATAIEDGSFALALTFDMDIESTDDHKEMTATLTLEAA